MFGFKTDMGFKNCVHPRLILKLYGQNAIDALFRFLRNQCASDSYTLTDRNLRRDRCRDTPLESCCFLKLNMLSTATIQAPFSDGAGGATRISRK